MYSLFLNRHKGLFVIDPALRKVTNSVELPGVSFNKIKASIDFIITSTHIGELLILDKASLRIKHRINTSLPSFSNFIFSKTLVCYSLNKGIIQLHIDSMKEKLIPLSEEVLCFCLYNNLLIFSSFTKIYGYNLIKNKFEFEEPNGKGVIKMIVDSTSGSLLTFAKQTELSMYKIKKKVLKPLNTIQIEHIGGINDILSLENHKFVLTAGIDKKIGVWQLN